MKRVRTATLVAAVAAALLIGGIGKAHAFTIGWNLIRVSACYAVSILGVDYLYVYPTTGGYLVTSDPIAVSAGAQFCANGNAFYAYWDGALWNGVVMVPGLK
jgi:hypothetical protein